MFDNRQARHSLPSATSTIHGALKLGLLLALCSEVGCTTKWHDDNPTRIDMGLMSGDPSTDCRADSPSVASYTSASIISYQSFGYAGSADPGEYASNVYTRRSDGMCTGSTSGRSRIGYASGEGDNWSVNGGATTYADCGKMGSSRSECTDGDSCTGTYEVKITQPPAAITKCSDFDKTRIENVLSLYFAARVAEEDHTCSAGSGTFRLLPVYHQDRDGDGYDTVYFVPIQISGTGTMTMNAWITSLTVDEDDGYDLRIVDPGFNLVADGSDAVTNLSSNSDLVTGTHTFSTGDHSGFAPFVVEEMDSADRGDLKVDLTWSCGTGATSVSRPSGYVVDLDALGCDATQKLVMRVQNAPNRLRWELYGDDNLARTTPTVNGSGGREFSIHDGDFYMSGTVVDWNSTQAEVEFDNIKWNGLNICTAGTYYLPAE